MITAAGAPSTVIEITTMDRLADSSEAILTTEAAAITNMAVAVIPVSRPSKSAFN